MRPSLSGRILTSALLALPLTAIAVPEIDVIDVTDGPPGTPLVDGQAAIVEFGCTMPNVAVTRSFDIVNTGSSVLTLPSSGLELIPGVPGEDAFSLSSDWPSALITPTFELSVTKASAGASDPDSVSFNLVTMPSILEVKSVKFRVPDRFTVDSGRQQSQWPYVEDNSFQIGAGSNYDPSDVTVSYEELLFTSGMADRFQAGKLTFDAPFTGSLDNPSLNNDLEFGFAIPGLNPPTLPPGTQADGDGYGQAGIEVSVELFNTETNTTQLVTGSFVDDGVDNDTSKATLTASPVLVRIPVQIPAGQRWSSVVGGPLNVQLLSGTEGAYAANWSLANDDSDENPFDFTIDGIVDGTDPVISGLPGDITVPETGLCSAVVTWAPPTVGDNLDISPTLVQTGGPVSGSTFNVGIDYEIEYTAMDCAGNMTVETFSVSVVDNQPPSLAGCLPPRIIANLPPGATEVAVPFPPLTASDNCDPNPLVVCSPPSGTLFGLGPHTVTCFAEDSSGNRSPSATVQVVVIQAQEPAGPNNPREADFVTERLDSPSSLGGATIFSFNHARVNGVGGVLLEAKLKDTPTTSDVALLRDTGSGLQVILREGDPAPGLGGATIRSFDELALSDLGLVGFEAATTAGVGHFSDSPGSILVGSALPGTPGSVKLLRSPAFDGLGNMYSPVLLTGGGVTTANDSGIWVRTAGGAIEPVMVEGDAVTNAPALAGAEYGQMQQRIVANALGHVAFPTALKWGPGGIGSGNNQVLLAGDRNALEVVAQRGVPAPGAGGPLLATFTTESISDTGRVAFESVLMTGGVGPAVNSSNRYAIFTNSNGPLEMVARQGQPVNPCTVGGPVFGTFREIFIADNGDVFFSSFLDGPGITKANDGSFWRWSAADSQVYPMLLEGEVAPSTQGAVVHSIIDMAAGAGGASAVNATLVQGVGDCTVSNDIGVWIDSGTDGIPLLRAREGDHLDLGGTETVVLTRTDLDTTVNQYFGSGGHGKVLNALGELIVMANYRDGSTTAGVFVITNP